jgi:hypothetical protein
MMGVRGARSPGPVGTLSALRLYAALSEAAPVTESGAAVTATISEKVSTDSWQPQLGCFTNRESP